MIVSPFTYSHREYAVDVGPSCILITRPPCPDSESYLSNGVITSIEWNKPSFYSWNNNTLAHLLALNSDQSLCMLLLLTFHSENYYISQYVSLTVLYCRHRRP